jgi:anti-sigma factor RsiW
MLAEALYGKMESLTRARLEEHLGHCDACRQEYTELLAAQDLMDKRKRPDPDPSLWESYWDRLEARMHREKVPYYSASRAQRLLRERQWRLPGWVLQAAAATALVVLGIFIGRVVLAPPSTTIPEVIQIANQAHDSGLELAARTQAYVRRSKLVLMAIVNFEPASEDPYTLDLPLQQRISRDLVQEAAWLKPHLAQARQRRLRELISDLETVLLQIANLETSQIEATVELVQTGVQSRGIFFKMHLAEVNRPWEDLSPRTKTPPKADKTKTL